MLDVANGPEVQMFMQTLLAEARGMWACNKNGSFVRGDSAHGDEYNPANDDMPFFRKLDWGLTGNWHLLMEGECKWKCGACKNGKCKCTTTCQIKGSMSKYYTFVYVPGGNWKNIVTTVLLYPFNLLGDTFVVDMPVTQGGFDSGTINAN